MSEISQKLIEQNHEYTPIHLRVNLIQKEKKSRLESKKMQIKEIRDKETTKCNDLYKGKKLHTNDIQMFMDNIKLWMERRELKNMSLKYQITKQIEQELSFKP